MEPCRHLVTLFVRERLGETHEPVGVGGANAHQNKWHREEIEQLAHVPREDVGNRLKLRALNRVGCRNGRRDIDVTPVENRAGYTR